MKKIILAFNCLLLATFSFGYDYPLYSKVLANGLKVIVCEKSDGEMVEVQVWYKAGSKDESDGIRGMAHMFEHMMFRGSKNYPGEGDVFIDSMEALGGSVNAYTTFDRTVYHETIPKEKIETVFKMEADRMSNLILSQVTLDIERQVVGEELRNGENNWFQRMHNSVYDQLYPDGHPYRVDVIGYLNQIVSFTTKQCQDFYDKFYSPNNAVLVVVGNVKHDEVFAMADKNFGIITKQIPEQLKYSTPDIFNDSLRQYEYSVDFPVQIYGYIIPKPAVGDGDFYKIVFLKDLLFTNPNSVFNKEIVQDMQAAYQISALSDDWSMYTNFCELYIIMQAAPGNVKVKKAINAEIQSIIDEGIDVQLMKDYLQNLKAQRILSLYQNDYIANELGMAELYLGDFQKYDEMIHAFENITPEQLQQTASKYFNPQNFKVLNIKPTF